MNIKPIFLVVDMQNGFCAPDGTLNKIGVNITNYRKIIPNLIKTISFMRGIGTPICYTKAIRETPGLDLLDRRIIKTLPENNTEKLSDVDLCTKDTWDADIVQEIYPHQGDNIVEKKRNSVFQDTSFEKWLRTSGADTIIFSGNDSYTCVESSARDAFNKGYKVITLSDCVASKEDKPHIGNLLEIAQAYGKVLTSNEVIEMFNSESVQPSGELPTVSLNP